MVFHRQAELCPGCVFPRNCSSWFKSKFQGELYHLGACPWNDAIVSGVLWTMRLSVNTCKDKKISITPFLIPYIKFPNLYTKSEANIVFPGQFTVH